MADIVIIGYGNELRGDDGVGPYIVRKLEARVFPGVRCLALHQLTPDLAEALSHARLAVFVDARTVTPQADIVVEELIPAEGGSSWSHASDPRSLVALARAIYGQSARAWLVSVAATDFGFGAELSETARRRASLAVEAIEQLLDKARAPDASPKRR